MGNLMHETATRARKRLREMIGEDTPVVTASNSETVKDLGVPFSGGPWKRHSSDYHDIGLQIPPGAGLVSVIGTHLLLSRLNNSSETQRLELRKA